jgi:hypothetical protein
MLGEILNALRQNSYLDVRRAGVLVVLTVLYNDFLLSLSRYRHRNLSTMALFRKAVLCVQSKLKSSSVAKGSPGGNGVSGQGLSASLSPLGRGPGGIPNCPENALQRGAQAQSIRLVIMPDSILRPQFSE